MDDTPIYDLLFTMQINLCERFPSMTPLSLRKERAREVFLLIGRLNKHTAKELKGKQQTTSRVNGKRVIRRPAGDDWF